MAGRVSATNEIWTSSHTKALLLGLLYCALLFPFAAWLQSLGPVVDGVGSNSYYLHGFIQSFEELPVLARWDSVWYLGMAQEGYWGDGPRSRYLPAFFPLYSLLVRLVHEVTGLSLVNSGLLLSLICFFAALVVFVSYLQRVWGCSPKQSTLGVLLLLAYPTAFLLLSVYYCALFFLLVTSTLLLVRQERFYLAAVTAFLAGLTHMHALALIGALCAVALKDRRPASFLPLAATSSAIMGLLLHHWIFYGDPLIYIEAKKFFSGEINSPVLLGQHFWDLLLRRVHKFRLYQVSELLEYVLLASGLLGLTRLAVLQSGRFLPEACAIALLCALQLSTGSSWGFTRFVMCWPILFAVCARQIASRTVVGGLCVLSLVLQVMYLLRWINWNLPAV
jgi:hypothetical protein